MQIYLVAIGVSELEVGRVKEAVESVGRAFDQLESGTLESGAAGPVVFGALRHADSVAAPRRYLARGEDAVVLLDGLPVGGSDGLDLCDARIALERWQELPYYAEGQFSAVRLDLEAGTVECLLDPLGMCPVFVAQHRGGHLVSNSVEAMLRLGVPRTPDELGVSSMLTLRGPLAATLVHGVERLPGGHRVSIARSGWKAERYFGPGDIVSQLHGPRTPNPASAARRLADLTARAARGVEPLLCALTAGRDTRSLLALASSSSLRPDYYTIGDPGDCDVVIAERLASELDLPYRRLAVDRQPPADWDGAARRFLVQTDGLSSLRMLVDHVDDEPVERLGLKLWGVGGETGRLTGFENVAPNLPLARASRRAQVALLERRLNWDAGVSRPAAGEAVRRHVERSYGERLEEGWPVRSLSEALFVFELVPSWHGGGTRRSAGTHDVFSPFCSRPYIEYCMDFSPEQRGVWAPQYHLISALDPRLSAMAFDAPWPSRRPRVAPALALQHAGGAVASRIRAVGGGDRADAPPEGGLEKAAAAWFEAHAERHAETCLSPIDSPLWEWIDRARLERLLRDEAPQRARLTDSLFRILTLFTYFHGEPGGLT